MSFGFLDTGLPLIVLGLLAAGLPWLLVPRGARGHGAAARGIGMSALVLLAVGVAMMAYLGARAGGDLIGLARAEPLGAAWILLRRSAMAALVWAPILVLVWFSMAQRVERLRGEDVMREGRG